MILGRKKFYSMNAKLKDTVYLYFSEDNDDLIIIGAFDSLELTDLLHV